MQSAIENTSSAQSSSSQDENAAATAIIASLRAAQHELDKGGSAEHALDHLLHVATVAPEYKAQTDFEAVWAAADSFDQSLRARSRKSPGRYQHLAELNQEIRRDIGLTGASKAHSDLSGGTDASYARAAIGPALDSLAVRTNDSLKTLEELESYDQAGRMRIVERVAGDIDFTSHYVSDLLERMPSEERHLLSGSSNKAARAIGKVLRWTRSRPAHEQLEKKLVSAVATLDAILETMGGQRIGERDAVPLSEDQQAHADTETREFVAAMDGAVGAVESLAESQVKGIMRFQALAGLDDLPQPDFKKELLDALIDETAKALLVEFAKAFVTSPLAHTSTAPSAHSSSRHLPESSVDRMLEVSATPVTAAGAAENTSGHVHKAERSPQPSVKIDPRKRALIYFCGALSDSAAARRDAAKARLKMLETRSAITTRELQDIEQLVNAQKATLIEQQSQLLARSWAQHLARSRLGSQRLGSGHVADMRDYFGVHRPGGRVFGTTKAGGDGILSILLIVEHGTPSLEREATQVIGCNSQLQADMFAGANYEVSRMEIPKEIHVEAGFARATIALDDINRIRDVIGWDQVERHVGGLSAYDFWHVWGQKLKVN